MQSNGSGVTQTQVQSAIQAVGQIGSDLHGISGLPGLAAWQSDLHQTWVDLQTANDTWSQSGGTNSNLNPVATDFQDLSNDNQAIKVTCS